MGKRVDLQYELESIVGSRNVYFQPPETIKMKYPAIVYELSSIRSIRADDINYKNTRGYTVTLITDDPDNPFIDKMLELNYCSFDRRLEFENLYQDVFTLYW